MNLPQSSVKSRHTTYFLMLITSILSLNFQALADETVSIQNFSSKGPYGTPVNGLETYTLHFSGGLLFDNSGAKFSSITPQWTSRDVDSACVIKKPSWAAVTTTYYVVLANDQGHMKVLRACGKSPYKNGGNQQYPDVDINRFVNHAQIAGLVGGNINQVIAAGEMDVVDGKIVYMDTCSGHFQPNVGSFLAYLQVLDRAGAFPITSKLKEIASRRKITSAEIENNFKYMKNNSSLLPTRDHRPGTGGCYSYSTVFDIYQNQRWDYTLKNGLMAVGQGPIQVFQSSINEVTNKNIKSIDARTNFGFFPYSAYVTTDWHPWNNWMSFYFTDESNDTYSLDIHVYTYNHEVDYFSQKPNINRINFKVRF